MVTNGADFCLKDRVAIVTGAKRGIGRAIALSLARAGAHIAVCSRVVEDGKLDAVAREIQEIGRRSLVIKADISQKVDVDNMVQKVVEDFGGVDILVNNAVVILRKPLLSLSESEWNLMMDTDLKGYFFCCQAVAQIMIEHKKGSIINVASRAGLKAASGRGAYSTAKAGVIMLTRQFAVELAPYKIRVNAIAPGRVMTEATQFMLDNPETYKRMTADIPLARWAEPTEMVGAVVFLASDASSYITGHTIVLDGGISA